jgi:hypothetical protein
MTSRGQEPTATASSLAALACDSAPASTDFDPESVTIFADDGGFAPALDSFPLAAKRLRDALLNVADREKLPIPTVLSGHDADRRPTTTWRPFPLLLTSA